MKEETTMAQTAVSPTDRLLGMLIERTEALREDTSELRRATAELKTVSVEVSAMLRSIVERIAAVERLPVIALERRLADCEGGVKDYRAVKESGIRWALRIAFAIILLGATGGAIARLALSL
ncbi:MAG TPA: hypothetical protein VII49_01710 [Rhizomicrobium sp.]